jgi:hypothetical protein
MLFVLQELRDDRLRCRGTCQFVVTRTWPLLFLLSYFGTSLENTLRVVVLVFPGTYVGNTSLAVFILPCPGSILGTTRKKKVVGLERGPLSLVSTTEELLDRKVATPV